MKLGIMQPYFFPYIGYFQLISAVEKFVFYDDVNYIKSGWINRNRLFLSGAIRYITVPLTGASSFEKINATRVKMENGWAESMLSSIQQSYGKAPYYKQVNRLLEDVLASNNGNLSDLAKQSIITTSNFLQLSTDFVLSSSVYDNQHKKSADRIIDICRIEKADEYWNLPGGRSLYNKTNFVENGIDLRFVDVQICSYQQSTPEFHPGLSILGVLMYNEPLGVSAMLNSSS